MAIGQLMRRYAKPGHNAQQSTHHAATCKPHRTVIVAEEGITANTRCCIHTIVVRKASAHACLRLLPTGIAKGSSVTVLVTFGAVGSTCRADSMALHTNDALSSSMLDACNSPVAVPKQAQTVFKKSQDADAHKLAGKKSHNHMHICKQQISLR